MLRFTDAKLKWISEKYQFIENVIWEGISMYCKSYNKADNIFLMSYDPTKSSMYIIYIGANNKYGHSMMQSLPIEIPSWVNLKEFRLYSYTSDSQILCFVEVDLDYLDEFHDFSMIILLHQKK